MGSWAARTDRKASGPRIGLENGTMTGPDSLRLAVSSMDCECWLICALPFRHAILALSNPISMDEVLDPQGSPGCIPSEGLAAD
ncbi:MAG: hypothetical protein ACJA2W_001709 [Planctomycetota bacterium]|jgi:hypothetical protein